MKVYNMFFLRRRSWILKAILLLTALWFMVALLSHGSRNLDGPSIEYVDAEAKPLKSAPKATSTKRKESSYNNNLSDGNYDDVLIISMRYVLLKF